MIDYAIEKARGLKRPQGQARVFCVITDKKGRVLAESENSYTKTHPTQKNYATKVGTPYKEYLHAEIAAIIRAKGKGVHLYVARVDASGAPVTAKPCPICQHAIDTLCQFKSITFT